MELYDGLREIGQVTSDQELTRGAMTVGAAVLAALLAGWRIVRVVFKGRTAADEEREPARYTIDAPANVKVTVEPVSERRIYP